MTLLIGSIEDNVLIFVVSHFLKGFEGNFFPALGYPYGVYFTILNSSQPVFWSVLFFLTSHFNTILVYNLVIGISLLVTWFQARRFILYFNKSKGLSSALALLFTLSPYFYYHSRSHLDLIQVWSLLWFINVFIAAMCVKQYLYAGILLFLTFTISNYLGFIGFLFVVAHAILVCSLTLLKKQNTSTMLLNLKKTVYSMGLFSFLMLLFVFSYRNGFLLEKSFPQDAYKAQVATKRGLDDFFEFSSRPWFLILPPQDNPFYGNVFPWAYATFRNICTGFVCSHYFKQEHTTSYLGVINITVILVFSLYLFRSLKRRTDLLLILGISCILYIVSLPPYISIAGSKIYFPSFIIWNIFPVFRVLCRINIVNLLIFLVFIGECYKYILFKYPKYKIIVVFLLILSLLDFFIPIKVYDTTKTPRVYEYIAQNTPPDSNIVVYPFSMVTNSMFWIPKHQRNLINIKGITPYKSNIDYEQFTDRLISKEGLKAAKDLGATYLLYFYNTSAGNEGVFEGSPLLHRVARFEERTYESREVNLKRLIILNGVDEKNNAILYKFQTEK